MNKNKRQERKLKNKEKDELIKEEALKRGKLIKENHNNGYYSSEFTLTRSEDLCRKLNDFANDSSNSKFINQFRLYKDNISNLLIYWSPEVPKLESYQFLLKSLNIYWDDPDNLLKKLYD